MPETWCCGSSDSYSDGAGYRHAAAVSYTHLDVYKRQVQKTLTSLGLLVKATYQEADNYEEGQVMTQSVAEGEMVKTGATINVTVCSGKEVISLPSLEGKEQSAAEQALKDLGLTADTQFAYSDTVDVGKVISTNPASGSDVVKGQQITVTVSQGPETKTRCV